MRIKKIDLPVNCYQTKLFQMHQCAMIVSQEKNCDILKVVCKLARFFLPDFWPEMAIRPEMAFWPEWLFDKNCFSSKNTFVKFEVAFWPDIAFRLEMLFSTESALQLNKYETDPYFLQIFQSNTTVCLIIYVFCKSCKHGCEPEIVQKIKTKND